MTTPEHNPRDDEPMDREEYEAWEKEHAKERRAAEEEDDEGEPVGSCENCGCNLYADDLGDLCDQCEWWVEEANRDG